MKNWEAYIGMRHDTYIETDRFFAVIGMEGVAPYLIETDFSVFYSEKNILSFRSESSRDFYITERWVLQPKIVIDAAFGSDREAEVGSGIITTKAAARLQYKISPDFAPYIGVQNTRQWAATRRFSIEEEEGWNSLYFIVGLTFSF